ncbi:MAG: hypothetical protein L0241_01440 [Planctomycetia bacterium]|nr:hypothetical protein [Planctomycetia bacterium]
MTFDDDAPLERSYPYRTSWKVLGCLALFFAAVGFGGLALNQFGCDLMRNGMGWVGCGVAAIGLFVAGMFLLSLVAIGSGIKEVISPDLLRITPTALYLPDSLRGIDNSEEAKKQDPPKHPKQPEEIPFSAIKWIRCETRSGPNDDRLMIVHDLSDHTLEIKQHMMAPTDFDELETVLRAAIPHVFTPVPPAPPSPPQDDGV